MRAWQNEGRMRRQAVESTTVRSIGYNARSQVLEVEFQSGTVYQYFDVPEAVHEEFRGADSKGKYFNLEIRDEYSFVRLTTVRRGTTRAEAVRRR